jgi:hypothetical protein
MQNCFRLLWQRQIGQFPTAKKVTFALRGKIAYKGSVSPTVRILKHLGFQYKRTHDGYIMERGNIVVARLKFLQTIHHLSEFDDSQTVFYLDETCVNQNHTVKYILQKFTRNGGLKVSYLRASGCSSLNLLVTILKKSPLIHFKIGF